MVIAGVVLIVVAAIAVGVALSGRRRWQAMLGTETSTCADLRADLDTARGLGGTAGSFVKACEVVGTAQPGPYGELNSELAGVPCVWYRYVIRRRYWETVRDSEGRSRREQRSESVADFTSETVFTLADPSGTVLVRPEGGSVDNAERVLDRFEPDRSGRSVSFLGLRLPGGSNTIGYEKEEWVVRPGTRLYVLGEATDRAGDLEVGRPGKGPFIMSTRSEAELATRARRTQQIGMAAGAVSLFAGLVLLITGLVR
jgi:hypothetical protein